MNVKSLLLLSFLVLFSSFTMGQTPKGCIVSIEGEQVYVDLTNAQIKSGDKLNVYVQGGYMTHPVTGKKIKKGDELLGALEVGAAYSEYSVARPYNASLLQKLKVGMTVEAATNEDDLSSSEHASDNTSSVNDVMTGKFVDSNKVEQFSPNEDKVAVVVAQAQVNDVVNSGHFGGYVADVLMEQLLLCDKVRLLDRSILNAQIDEINLAGDILDERTTIQRGKVIGARYILQTTMQKPDIANVRTGIPLASIMGAVQGISGKNIGAAYASNAEVATLKASVSISVRVVDLQTGEIVFMCSGSGKSQGKSQLRLEYGALGGGELNGGAEDFKQTVTGKAIQQAFIRIGKTLNDFFLGNIDKKVVGSVSGGRMNSGDKMYAKGRKLYLGTERLDKEGIQMSFADCSDLFFDYRKAKRFCSAGTWTGIGGSLLGVGLMSLLCSGDDDVATLGYSIGGGLVIVSSTAAVLMNISGRKRIKGIVSTYNNRMTAYHQTPVLQLGLAMTNNGIGLRLTF